MPLDEHVLEAAEAEAVNLEEATHLKPLIDASKNGGGGGNASTARTEYEVRKLEGELNTAKARLAAHESAEAPRRR